MAAKQIRIRRSWSRKFVSCVGLAVFGPAPMTAARPAQQGSNPTRKDNVTVPPTEKQAGITFKPEGPLGLTYVLDDGGKPLMIKDKNGELVPIPGGTTWWRASDGQKVYTSYTNLITPAFALQYLKDKLLNAQVLKREPRTDEKGKIVGERIVALLYIPTEPHKRGLNDPHKTMPAVIRTTGTKYSEITSDSLDDALAFEKSPHNPPWR